jgi:hypothetical protein
MEIKDCSDNQSETRASGEKNRSPTKFEACPDHFGAYMFFDIGIRAAMRLDPIHERNSL